MTIYGWDSSDFDWARGPMDLKAARAAGIDFFTHKATEATSVRHQHFGEAMRRARAAGIPLLGAYHVVRSPANAGAEVDYCLAYVDQQTPWWRDFPGWFWQVDLERWSYDSVPASEGEAFADIIEAKTGRRAIIYASKGQYGNALAGSSHPLWNANYGSNSAGDFKAVYAQRGGDKGAGWTTYSGGMPTIWQYGSKTKIGPQSTCDANAFRGTLEELRALLTGDDMPNTFTDQTVKDWNGALAALYVWHKQADALLKTIAEKVDLSPEEIAAVAAATPQSDPSEVARLVLAGLEPAALAAAIVSALPADLARQVADELAARLAS